MKLKAAVMVFAATALMAQTPPAGRFDAVQTALGLTDAQVTQLLELRKQEREALRTTFQAMRTKQQALRDALQSGSTDATALGNLLVEIQSLRKKVQETNDSYRTQALALLNDQQKANLTKLEEAIKLRPAIGQAAALNLLQGPGAGVGPGPMPMLGMGPQGLGGAGAGMAPMRLRGLRRAVPQD